MPAVLSPWYSGIVSLVLSVLVSLALTLGPGPVRLPGSFEDIETRLHELAEQQKYGELARFGAAAFERRDLEPYQRRMTAFFAVRGLHGTFAQTGRVADLCAARRLLRRVTREVGLAEDAGTAARLEQATAKYLAATRLAEVCTKPKAEPSPSTLVERDTRKEQAGDDVLFAVVPSVRLKTRGASDMSNGTGNPAGPLEGPRETDSRDAASVAASLESPAETPRVASEARSGRPLAIAGGLTLAVGLGLAGVAGYSGGRALTAYREGVELHRDVQGPPDDAARARDAALESEYRTMGGVALGMAFAGATAVIVGAVLSGIGGRRLARQGSRTALLPAPGGLALSARF